jgi:hypothetical protein
VTWGVSSEKFQIPPTVLRCSNMSIWANDRSARRYLYESYFMFLVLGVADLRFIYCSQG